jgi:hypothetical protein
MSALDMIEGAVIATVTPGVLQVPRAPLDAVSEHIRERVKARLDRTRSKAEAKAGGRDLTVPDRVAYKVLMEAAFSDDEIISDYLGGVLAAAGNDDEGAAVVAQIARLSATQLLFHYVVYRELGRLWPPTLGMNLYQESLATRHAGIRFYESDLTAAFGTRRHLGAILAPLHREGLIVGQFRFGIPVEGESGESITEVRPSASGAELFLWGHGNRDRNANLLISGGDLGPFLEEVPATPRAELIQAPSKELAKIPGWPTKDTQSQGPGAG